MAHHEKLRTDDFDDRGRNQYEHNDTPRHGRPPGNTYEERYYGHSRRGEESRPTYAGSGSQNNYGQRGDSRGYDQRSRQDQPQQRPYEDDRRYREQDNQSRGFNSGPQNGGYEYYRRDNSQFRSYNDLNERREYPARRDEDAPSYIHYSHQRPGGITPRDYHQGDAHVRGNEANRGRENYSRSSTDRGFDPYADGYDRQPGRNDQNRGNYGPSNYRRDDDRRDNSRPDRGRGDDRDQSGLYDGSNRDGSRSDFGYGDDYSSSLYDPNSRNSAFRRRDDRDEDRHGDGRNNRRWTDTPDLDNRSYR